MKHSVLDVKRINPDHKKIVEASRQEFINLLTGQTEFVPSLIWENYSKDYRMKLMAGFNGVWEITWNKSKPDLRSTFVIDQFTTGEQVVVWARIGDHSIYKDPEPSFDQLEG